MNLPPPVNSNAYAFHLRAVEKAAKEEGMKCMLSAVSRVKTAALTKEPELIREDADGAVPVAISIDGTWQRRGYSSRYGAVFVISVDTGEVLDYELLSLFCHECKAHQNDNKETDSYKDWKKGHEANCNINYEGSSGAMEGKGALAMYKRSIETRNLKYTTLVGDGDSDTFKVIKESMACAYGKRYVVKKEECIGHIQKRMGAALRRFVTNMKGKKLEDGKTVGGKGRLTKDRINSIQRYFGRAIRENIGKLYLMKKRIWGIFLHSVKNPSPSATIENSHMFCPIGKTSWCKFQRDKLNNTKTYTDKNMLPAAFYSGLKPIFENLTNDDILERCQAGLTQNANESLHNVLWSKCPKNYFCGKERLNFAVNETITVFNSGAASKAVILETAGAKQVGRRTYLCLRKEDRQRFVSSAQKVSKRYKIARLRNKKRLSTVIQASKKHYIPGGFDTLGEANNLIEQSQSRKRTAPQVEGHKSAKRSK